VLGVGLGAKDGLGLGRPLVGDAVGDMLGVVLGAEDGLEVGWALGDALGDGLGGAGLGAAVAAMVGSRLVFFVPFLFSRCDICSFSVLSLRFSPLKNEGPASTLKRKR
jgi:hypothetical protein